MEDTWVVSPQYIAVFDGATPKTAFRFADGSTPGQIVARTLAEATQRLSPTLTAVEAITLLTQHLHQVLQGHQGEASGVIYNVQRKEIWIVGDCQFAFVYPDGKIERHHTEKLIDRVLAQWRCSINRSYLNRHLMTTDEIQKTDPGRKIIQPFITRQRIYQNISNPECPWGFGAFDGTPIPSRFIEVYPVPDEATAIILASDGYPTLYPTLEETEKKLKTILKKDPFCMGILQGTKGIRPGNQAHDDRTFIRIEIQ